MQSQELQPNTDPELGIQVAQGFIKQKEFGTAHQGAAHGDSLSLTAREFPGFSLEQVFNSQTGRHLRDLLFYAVPGHAAHSKAETHVLCHGHVRIEGVPLKYHGDVPFSRGESVNRSAIQKDGTLILGYQARHNLQQRTFPAARRPQKHAEFAFLYPQIHAGKDSLISKTFTDLFQFQ